MKQWWRRRSYGQRWLIGIGTFVVLVIAVLIVSTNHAQAPGQNTANDTTEYWGSLRTDIPSFGVKDGIAFATVTATQELPLAANRAGHQLQCWMQFRTAAGENVTEEYPFTLTVPDQSVATKEIRTIAMVSVPGYRQAVPQLNCKDSVKP